ncbi:hypothetical protein [Fulvimarina sp. MAC8]|uniref:hypothetical protein n=1 Tax=Fulvimarina sp. MAC8 TaxID=3162874 RepID=UPI0032EFDE2D
MPDRITRYIRDIQMKQNLWNLNVASPYTRAYDAAFERYQDTLKRQSQRDRAEAELLIFAASVVTGSVMMAVFAQTSLRILAGRALLSTICDRELNRTFNALHAISNSNVAMFALGRILDEAKGQTRKHLTDAAADLTRKTDMATADTALNFQTRIGDFVRSNAICAHQAAAAVQDNTALDDAEKDAIAARLETAPFFNPPSGSLLNEERLAEKLELSFYMTAVLDSDFLVHIEPQFATSVPGVVAGGAMTERSIEMSPSSDRYPVSTEVRPMFGGIGARDVVSIRDLGGTIRHRIDTLHRSIFNRPFYTDSGGLFGGKPTTRRELIKAETVLSDLAHLTRPQSIADVRT